MFQFLNSHLKDPTTLRDVELEPTFINLKNQIIVTDIEKNETKYRHLYFRIGGVLSAILQRHNRYFIETDAKITTSNLVELFVQQGGDNWAGKRRNYCNHNLRLERFDSDILLYLCFLGYLGGTVNILGSVAEDHVFVAKTLDFLIKKCNYMPAVFFQGFIFKYGVKLYHAPKLDLAKNLLEIAAASRTGGAIIELQYFDQHVRNNRYNRAIERL